MNTTGIKEEKIIEYNLAKTEVKLSGVEGAGGIVSDADSAEGVTLELSAEGRQKLEAFQQTGEQMKQMREDNEDAAEYADDTSKIMTIFRRIANGDIVPPKDENKLMEHSMEMYQAAKNLGSMKQSEDRKKYKSVDDEDEESNGAISREDAIRALAENHLGVSIDIKISDAE